MTEQTLETLKNKLEIYERLLKSFAPSVSLDALTPSSNISQTPTEGSLTPVLSSGSKSTEGSLTPAPSKIIFKPNKRYIKVEELLKITELKKNEYNNLLVSKEEHIFKSIC